jgi:hypothetical protein
VGSITPQARAFRGYTCFPESALAMETLAHPIAKKRVCTRAYTSNLEFDRSASAEL